MLTYVDKAGYKIVDGKLEVADRLIGYHSAKEIGDFVEDELGSGLSVASLSLILRVVPKLVIDWQNLPYSDALIMASARPVMEHVQWQALIESIVRFFFHTVLWQDAPTWTNKTKLKHLFIPRAALSHMGAKRIERLIITTAPEFMEKRVLFSTNEMKLI
jgi:hypothetical protein